LTYCTFCVSFLRQEQHSDKIRFERRAFLSKISGEREQRNKMNCQPGHQDRSAICMSKIKIIGDPLIEHLKKILELNPGDAEA